MPEASIPVCDITLFTQIRAHTGTCTAGTDTHTDTDGNTDADRADRQTDRQKQASTRKHTRTIAHMSVFCATGALAATHKHVYAFVCSRRKTCF
jgi:GTP cyclohydrolase III